MLVSTRWGKWAEILSGFVEGRPSVGSPAQNARNVGDQPQRLGSVGLGRLVRQGALEKCDRLASWSDGGADDFPLPNGGRVSDLVSAKVFRMLQETPHNFIPAGFCRDEFIEDLNAEQHMRVSLAFDEASAQGNPNGWPLERHGGGPAEFVQTIRVKLPHGGDATTASSNPASTR